MTPFDAPYLDYHALAPEIVLTVAVLATLLVDLVVDETSKYRVAQVAGVGLLAALVPVFTLALDGADRSLFGGAYVVDDFALVLKGLLLVSGYLVLLLATDYLREGDFYEGEFSFLLLSSLLGMVVMASSRDLITIFVALELLSIPAYLLAGWRKRDLRSNEASLKYYLLGVLASAVMLYGMSLIFGVTGTTVLADVNVALAAIGDDGEALVTLGIVLSMVGFTFKISAVPFHSWAPDTYEGSPIPVTAFLSVASKTAGFAALLQLAFVGFLDRNEVWGPLFWVLAVLTMSIGNLTALRQTDITRMLAYSSVAQGGFILVPVAVAGGDLGVQQDALQACLVYLLIYAAMNLGAFGVVIAVVRKTGSTSIRSFGGLFSYAPGLAVLMAIFLASLAGIPPLGGWFAKLGVFNTVLQADNASSTALGVIAAVNTVIGAYYYLNVVREMFMRDAPDGDVSPVRVPAAVNVALGLAAAAVVVLGFYPNAVARLGNEGELIDVQREGAPGQGQGQDQDQDQEEASPRR